MTKGTLLKQASQNMVDQLAAASWNPCMFSIQTCSYIDNRYCYVLYLHEMLGIPGFVFGSFPTHDSKPIAPGDPPNLTIQLTF